MATYPIKKVVAYARSSCNLAGRCAALLTAKHVDIADEVTAVGQNATLLSGVDENQETAKTDQTTETKTLKTSTHSAYDIANGALKRAVSALGKKSAEAKQGNALRGDVTPQSQAREVGAFCEGVAAFLTEYKPRLLAARIKYDPTEDITALGALSGSLDTGKGVQQDKIKDRGEASDDVFSARDDLYDRASNILTAVLGCVATDSEEAKEVQRIRDALYGRGTEGGEEPPAPPPQPPAPPTP
ncbi:MAG: hypothetical protein HZC54_20200 [Verrucomicrobia bacterium]|nr:hypothetical protein [Verrucomicrobiota bacterium]